MTSTTVLVQINDDAESVHANFEALFARTLERLRPETIADGWRFSHRSRFDDALVITEISVQKAGSGTCEIVVTSARSHGATQDQWDARCIRVVEGWLLSLRLDAARVVIGPNRELN